METSEKSELERDYLNLVYLVKVFKNQFRKIFLIAFLSGTLSIIYALSLSNFYTSTAKFSPVSNFDDDVIPGGGLAGVVAGISGVNIGGSGGNRMNYTLEILGSTDFFKNLYKEEDFLLELSAVYKYDPKTGKLIINENLFDTEKSVWIEDSSSFTKTKKPSLLSAKQKFFSEHISSAVDIETNFITISITHSSPYIAEKWLRYISKELDSYIQNLEIKDIEERINFLNRQLAEPNSSEVNRALSRLLENQMKTLMVSKGSAYIIKTIDSPSFPEVKSGPSRSRICIVLTILGTLLGYLIILFWDLNKSRNFFNLN